AAIFTGLLLVDSSESQWLPKVMGGFVAWEVLLFLCQDIYHRFRQKDTRHQTLIIRHSSSDTDHQTLIIRHSSSDTDHQTLVIRHSSSDTDHQTLVIRH
ncbi:putative ferric-chelate reductase 1, partial [Tachysurus ichikawai]